MLTNMRSVGVMGDGRTYDYTLALRSVTTSDFMTADWARIPYEVLDRVSVRIVNEVKHINRIVYDITSKPPATIELQSVKNGSNNHSNGKGEIFMKPVPQDLLWEYVKSQQFTSTADIMTAMKEMFRDVIQAASSGLAFPDCLRKYSPEGACFRKRPGRQVVKGIQQADCA